MSVSLVRSAVVLGTLSMVGPFAIDMYLPAMPAIATDLGAGETAVQATITSYFIAFGIAQLIYGPWADQSGRKLPIFVGVGVFLIASIGAAMAGSVAELTAWRFLQGLGGAVLMVVPRAIIRDMHTGADATRLMAMIMLVISVSPMLAPLAGSGILAFAGWRVIFGVIAAAALISLTMTATLLPETLPAHRRTRANLRSMLKGARTLLTDPGFMSLTFIGAFGMASFFVFLASASFVYMNQFGLSPTGFSLAFAVNAAGFFTASQFAGPLAGRIGLAKTIRLGTGVFAGFTLVLLVISLLGGATLPIVIGFLLLGNAGLGLVIPTTMVMALEDHGDLAGLASSLGGTLQMLTGGVMIVAASPFFDGTATPMVAAIALCGAIAFGLTVISLRRQQAVAG
ncbi:Bcr/CflA family drug resistance efflux transporter [Aliiroseovarius zhejiangensis]|uniref:Bcr/CflA family efflux transporter n=1 Tax=Aliiroseovarius zhejiangensis TaxID=1632025 RepID=A0ABQ3J936_9RHOB|nr:multidrug effflux MFS transporter [Aliiroseovarius zhejiangensis]GHF05912.1 Bcr/CflA family drug resistance efflux transporter [Aliiroseovarius zhejiangensis]